LGAEDVGADAIFGYDHFLVPAVTGDGRIARQELYYDPSGGLERVGAD
jgi:hypothetical protein